MRRLYSLAFCLLLPLALLYFLWRSRREPAYRKRWAERFGGGPAPRTPGGVWLHAASVGEVQAARPLVDWLLGHRGDLPLTFTCVTPTGSERIRALWGERVTHQYLPFDTPGAVKRFLERVQPCATLIVESEIWPNLYAGCGARGVPLLMVSARLSESSLARLARFPGAQVLRETLGSCRFVLAQTEGDAERFRRAGAAPARVEIAGNLKFDYQADPAAPSRAQVLRERWGAARRVWLAASTHEPEEEMVLEAHKQLRRNLPELLLILAPRHPQRFEAVAALCASAGLTTARRSRGETGEPATAVLLVDSIGELNQFYAAADLAFVGGSLVPVGGHNLLEPAALSLPILCGPHTHKQAEIAQLLEAAGGLKRVTNANEMEQAASAYLRSPELHARAGAAARAVIERNRGTLARVVQRLEGLLPAAAASVSPRVPARP